MTCIQPSLSLRSQQGKFTTNTANHHLNPDKGITLRTLHNELKRGLCLASLGGEGSPQSGCADRLESGHPRRHQRTEETESACDEKEAQQVDFGSVIQNFFVVALSHFHVGSTPTGTTEPLHYSLAARRPVIASRS